MSYYSRDLTGPCNCAITRDSEWFVLHPDRVKYVREPWDCELTDLIPEHQGVVSQIVAVWIEKSVDQLAKERNEDHGIITVQVSRRSFLFVGEADWTRIDSDQGVDRFMLFINDEVANPSGARAN